MRINGPAPLPLATEMPDTVGAVKFTAAAKGTQDIAHSLDAKLARFWEGMLDTMEERSGVEGIQHDRDRDLNHLGHQSRSLRAEIQRMPDGYVKDHALDKLDRFVQDNTKRIEDTYQRSLAHENGWAPPLDEKVFAMKIRMKDLL